MGWLGVKLALKKKDFLAVGMLDALLEFSYLWEFGIPIVGGMGLGWGWDIG